ncbi:glycine cleavage system protein T [Caulobacter sp. CCUG 60055]|nr:glycine cleavage system protein T [Caulobacter sp. CCUG 60055]
MGSMSASPFFAALPSRALISVAGPDWRDFLHNLLTNDVAALKAGEVRFAALLTPQGRLLFDLFVIGREDGCWLDCQAERRAALIQRLSIYRLRAKVEIAADEAGVGVLFGDAALAPRPGWSPDPRLPALGLRGYGQPAPADARPADEADYETLRLALGAPGPGDWGEDRAYPIEADFDLLGGIDFHKGCFIGQETTSRMKRRGVVKSRMAPIAFDGPPPPPGTEILAGELRAGEVLSGVEGRAMALLRLDRVAGAALTADGRPVRMERPAWFPADA